MKHDALVSHIRRVLASEGHERVELEWRLGHVQFSGFRSGVDAGAWALLQKTLEDSPAFTPSYEETVEKLGAHGTKCIVHTESGATTWLRKSRLANVDADVDGRPWSVRASVSLEEHGTPRSLPPLQYERHKQRWSYRHACWRVDMTKVRSNLPDQLDDDAQTHEIEVELMDNGIFFEKTVDFIVEWGYRIVDELCGFMSPASS